MLAVCPLQCYKLAGAHSQPWPGTAGLFPETCLMCAVSLQTEIAEVQSIGVPADRIFYSSPCKQVAHVKYAASHGVQLMTFDNEVELGKVARSHPQARWVLVQNLEAALDRGSMVGFGEVAVGWWRPKDSTVLFAVQDAFGYCC